jgi:hypothetical protein
MTLYKAMAAIAVLGAVLLVLGGVLKHAKHGVGWVLGGVGWFGFLACVLALVVLALVALVRGARRKVIA